MWDLLKQTDIDQAKQDIKLRRAEILRRHAQETRSLDSDQVEVEILNHLIDIFTLKFKNPRPLSPKPIPAPVVREKVPAAAPVTHEKVQAPAPIVHEKAPAPAPVVSEKVGAKSIDVDHAHSPRSPGITPVTPVKAADHVRTQKTHGSAPPVTRKEERFHPRDHRGAAGRESRHHNGHKYPRTNFEVFSRALARELSLEP
jgi:hypothetical protein